MRWSGATVATSGSLWTRLCPGTRLSSGPGEKIPLDGVVLTGHSDVNEAPLTGESRPIDKGPGAEVFAGTINGRGAMELRVARLGRDSRLSHIIHLVETAQAQRAPVRRSSIDSRGSTRRSVLALAVVVAVVPPLAGAAPLGVAVSCARPARHRLPLRARDLDAGLDRRGALSGGTERSADQGWRLSRAARRHPHASPSTRPAR